MCLRHEHTAADFNIGHIICVEVPVHIAALYSVPHQEANRSSAEPTKLRSSSRLSLAKLTVAIEPVEGHLSILADFDEVAIGITHVAAPFPAVRIG